MPRVLMLPGQRFTRLTIIKEVAKDGKHRRFRCQCDCGATTVSYISSLRSGTTKSCGCLKRDFIIRFKTTHGLCRRPERHSWHGARQRCHNPNEPAYKNYGARGIVVCDRWRNDFAAFYADMGPRPSPQHTLDRIDNDGPYAPDNCRWVKRSDQLRNTRRSIRLTFNGQTKCLEDWAIDLGINPRTLWGRIRHAGWSVERALTTPVRK